MHAASSPRPRPLVLCSPTPVLRGCSIYYTNCPHHASADHRSPIQHHPANLKSLISASQRSTAHNGLPTSTAHHLLPASPLSHPAARTRTPPPSIQSPLAPGAPDPHNKGTPRPPHSPRNRRVLHRKTHPQKESERRREQHIHQRRDGHERWQWVREVRAWGRERGQRRVVVLRKGPRCPACRRDVEQRRTRAGFVHGPTQSFQSLLPTTSIRRNLIQRIPLPKLICQPAAGTTSIQRCNSRWFTAGRWVRENVNAAACTSPSPGEQQG